MPRAPRILRTVVLPLVLVAALLGAVTPADGADCGKQVISEYFNTGRIGYHAQGCYTAALKQVDPDARMYSGIMGAIRAARARDKAADDKAAAPPATDAAPVDTSAAPPVDTTPVTVETAPLPTDTVIPTVPAEARTGAIRTQAAQAIADAKPSVPLPVIVLAGLAALLLLVGLGGLAVRHLDRGY